MRKVKHILAILLLLILSVSVHAKDIRSHNGRLNMAHIAATGEIFVDSANGSDANNGTTWATAFKTLSSALSYSTTTTTIYVAKGTYYPTGGLAASNRDAAFLISRGGLKIYGGYPSGGGNRNIASYPTILSGDIGTKGTNTDNSYHVMVIARIANTADSIVVDGFTFTGSYSTDYDGFTYSYNNISITQYSGGGIALSGVANAGKTTIRNCIFSGNTSGSIGGGMYNENSSPSITNCFFAENMALNGGSVYNLNASPTITNCSFAENVSFGNGSGGAMYNSSSSSPTVTNCSFAGNTTGRFGGAMYNLSSSSPTLTNCSFTGNLAIVGGGAIYNFSSSNPTLTNCTIAGNKAGYGGGIYNAYSNNSKIRNTIIYGNTAANIGGIYNDNSTPTVTYSLVQGGYAGTGNISVDPLFVNAVAASSTPTTAGNYHLQAGSPAINAGDPSTNNSGYTVQAGSVDLEDSLRIVGCTIDMGAYEMPSGTIRYVDSAATGNNTGNSWANAYTSLSAALSAASACSDIQQIYVAKGTYYPTGVQTGTNRDSTFLISRGRLQIYGGYPSGGGTRNATANPTILSGDIGTLGTNTDNSYHVMVIAGIASAADSIVVDGFTFSRSYSTSSNSTSYSYNSKSISRYYGGGIALSGVANTGKTIIQNCSFSGNTAGFGACIFNASSSPILTNCTLAGNSAAYGAGLYNNASNPTLTNCIISGNSISDNGAAIANFNASSPKLINCTIANNRAGNAAGGIYNINNSNPLIVNTIIYGNTPASSGGIYNSTASTTSTPTVTYSLIQSGYSGTDNISTDPLFVNPVAASSTPTTAGNYHLQAGSPAINAGDPSTNNSGYAVQAGSVDLEDSLRIVGCTIDMGAYEMPSGTIRYVDSAATGNNTGNSWENAYTSLSAALSAASACSDVQQICVAKGYLLSYGCANWYQ